jgi:hypothetical protein
VTISEASVVAWQVTPNLNGDQDFLKVRLPRCARTAAAWVAFDARRDYSCVVGKYLRKRHKSIGSPALA